MVGPFLLFRAALVGFFAFAAIYHLVLWVFSRRQALLAFFSADCAFRAAFSAVLVLAITASTPVEADAAVRVRVAFGFLMSVSWLWSVSLVSGVRPRWLLWPVSIGFLLLALVHSFVFPLNSPVLSLDRVVLPWGETIVNPRLGPSGRWFAPLYAIVIAIEFFGFYCGWRVWGRDRLAGALLQVAAGSIAMLHVLVVFMGPGTLLVPFFGAIPQVIWVGVIALLIAREHRQTLERLAITEERVRTLGEEASDGIFIADVTGHYIDVNPAGCAMLGFSRDELLGLSIADIIAPEETGRLTRELGRLEGGKPVRSDWRFRRKNGSIFEGEVHARQLPNRRFLAVVRDITDRKHAEAALQASEARLAAVIANSPGVAVQWYDREGRVVLWNTASEAMFGFSAREAVGKTLDQLIHSPEEYRLFVTTLADISRTGQPIRPTEYTFHRRNGDVGVCLSTLFRIPGPGNSDWFVCMDVDITDRKRTEETIRHILGTTAPTTGRDFFQALVNHLCRVCRIDYAFIGAIDAADSSLVRSIAASRQGETIDNFSYALAGTPCEKVLRQDLCYYPTEIQQTFPEDVLLVQMGIDSYMGIPLASSHGQVLGLIVLLHSQPIVEPQQAETVLRVVAARAAAELERELEEVRRRAAEQALQDRETFLRLAQEAAQVGSWEWDMTSNRFKWSDELARMTGIGTAGFDSHVATILSICLPEDVARFQEAMSRALAGKEIEGFECRIRRRDDTVRDVWFLGRLHRDDRGAPTKLLGVAIDVTDRKKAEEQSRVLATQLAQSQKMEAIGRLAGGVAHDFNNLLTIINGYCEMVQESTPPDDERADMLECIGDAGKRAAALTRQLLTFSRQQVVERRLIDLHDVVREAELLLRRLIGEDVRVETVSSGDLPRVKADPAQIGQVVMNLAVNARDAMPKGGTLTIETENVEIDEASAQLYPGARPGTYVLLAVSDTGSGMTREVQSRIFEPFFTTKAPGKGTGIGLATVRTIAEESGGFVSVYSELNRGSTFKVYLPVADSPLLPGMPDTEARESWRGSETILLVEDQDAVRAVTRHMLRQSGYTVVEAGTGQEALRICEERPGPIHLLISDVVMPELNGRELAERAIRVRPNLKVLYLSGYTADAVVRHGVLQAEVAFLQKPFTTGALARKVREVLHQGAEALP